MNQAPYGVILILCAFIHATTFAGQFQEDNLQKYIVDSHNEYRSTKLKWPAANMLEIEWSPTLASYAENWANRCQFQHSQGQYGENIYMDSGMGNTADKGLVDGMMKGWGADEMANDVNIPTPADGEGVGAGITDHYTQIVWAKTKRVGCGYAICPNMRFVVCSYDPPGNFNGEGWYIKGTSCSQCPTGTSCKNQLCSSGGSPDPPPSPSSPGPDPGPSPGPTPSPRPTPPRPRPTPPRPRPPPPGPAPWPPAPGPAPWPPAPGPAPWPPAPGPAPWPPAPGPAPWPPAPGPAPWPPAPGPWPPAPGPWSPPGGDDWPPSGGNDWPPSNGNDWSEQP